MITIEAAFLAAALFLLASIFASKLAVKAGVPALLLFLIVGMLAGSDGPGGIYFDYPWAAQAIGVAALIMILFSGGLDTRWRDIRPVLWHGIALATVGVSVTALAVGAFAVALLGFSWTEGILLGAIIASTDAAAVFSVLRGRTIRLRSRLQPLLELESGSNDPMAVFLTIGMTQLIVNPALTPLELIPMFIQQMGIGALMGLGCGRLMVLLVNRLRLEYDGLYPVLTISGVLLTYGSTTVLGGNGFLAVYLAGLVMGQSTLIHQRSLRSFHDGLAWLMQIAMFVALGLQVYPSRLPAVALSGLSVALFLIVVARPLSVFLALAAARMRITKKLFIAWVGLRGAAPIVLATFPLLAGVERSAQIFDLVFFIVLVSVLLQGTLIAPVAHWLNVQDTDTRHTRSPLEYVMRDQQIGNDLIELRVAAESTAANRSLIDLHLPQDILVVLIGRAGDMIVPRGDTTIRPGDKVLLLARPHQYNEIRSLFERGEP